MKNFLRQYVFISLNISTRIYSFHIPTLGFLCIIREAQLNDGCIDLVTLPTDAVCLQWS